MAGENMMLLGSIIVILINLVIRDIKQYPGTLIASALVGSYFVGMVMIAIGFVSAWK